MTETETRETFAQYIARHRVRFEFVDIGPGATSQVDRDKRSRTYGKRLTGRRYHVRGTSAHLGNVSTGDGIAPGARWLDLPEYTGSIHDANRPGRKPIAPDPADYLSCLVLDSSYADYGIDELADELGANMKPTAVIAMHAALVKARYDLRALLGPAVAELDELEPM